MKKLVIFSALILFVKNISSQSPGGVGTGNLRGWFDASTGVTLTGGAVSTWTDRSSVGNATQGTAGERPTVTTATINYNNALTFDGSNDHLDLADRMLSTVTGVSAYAVARQTGTGNDTWGSIINGQTSGPSWTGGGYGLVALNSGNTQQGFYVRDYNTKGVSFSISNGIPFLSSGVWNGTSANNVEGFKNGTSAGTTAYTPGTVGDNGTSWIGSGDGGNTNYCFYGNIAEIAIYNTGLSSANNNKVMTYFALKYGITLGANYNNSAGTTIFTRSGSYLNNIIGITRDDGSGLIQKQSKNVDDSTRIYLSTLAASNSANAGTFSSDLSHVVIGADNGNLCASFSTTAEIPSGFGIVKRLDREWKVVNTNFGGTFSLDFKLPTCAILGSITVSQLRLLIDDDGNFSAGTNTAVASGSGGITISYSNPLLTISGISNSLIASGATKYITIGSASGATPLPIKLRSFSGSITNKFNSIEWTTDDELNFSHFELERSNNTNNFMKVATIFPKKGKNSDVTSYRFEDEKFSNSIVYYRLKMIDLDGSFEYSKIIVLKESNYSIDIKIFPNPTNNGFYISGNNTNNEVLKLELNSISGKKVYSQILNLNIENQEEKQFIDLKNLPQGIYFINVTGDSGYYYNEKLILIN